jgi:hypothetical protein
MITSFQTPQLPVDVLMKIATSDIDIFQAMSKALPCVARYAREYKLNIAKEFTRRCYYGTYEISTCNGRLHSHDDEPAYIDDELGLKLWFKYGKMFRINGQMPYEITTVQTCHKMHNFHSTDCKDIIITCHGGFDYTSPKIDIECYNIHISISGNVATITDTDIYTAYHMINGKWTSMSNDYYDEHYAY